MADVLSDVLRSVRLRGGVFLDARFTAPWAVSSYLTTADCRPILSGPAQMIGYHFITEGRVQIEVVGEPPKWVRAGEVVLLPRNDTHVLSSASGLKPVDGHHLVRPSKTGGLADVVYGGGGEPTRMICGFLGCEDPYNPLIASLPRLLVIDVDAAAARGLIEASLKFAVSELVEGRVADSSVLSRLSEFLFIEAVRRYADSLGDQQTGWLNGLRDPQVGRALALIHQNIAAPWSAETLAKDVGMSRSAFMQRFATLVGQPPIKYLTVWRMEAAKLHLRESTKTVAQVAYSVGYDSDEAFSRAFKRETGVSPTDWRN